MAEMNQSDTCSFETQRYIFRVRSNGTNVTSSSEVFMQQKKRVGGEKGMEGEKGRVFIHTAQGTSPSEAVAIESGHAGIEGQL